MVSRVQNFRLWEIEACCFPLVPRDNLAERWRCGILRTCQNHWRQRLSILRRELSFLCTISTLMFSSFVVRVTELYEFTSMMIRKRLSSWMTGSAPPALERDIASCQNEVSMSCRVNLCVSWRSRIAMASIHYHLLFQESQMPSKMIFSPMLLALLPLILVRSGWEDQANLL